MVKKGNESIKKDRNMDGFWVERKIRRVTALASCLLARMLLVWFQLWVSLCHSNYQFRILTNHAISLRILSNKNKIRLTCWWKKARGCDCFYPERHTVWLQTHLKPQVSNLNLVNVRIGLTDKTPFPLVFNQKLFIWLCLQWRALCNSLFPHQAWVTVGRI